MTTQSAGRSTATPRGGRTGGRTGRGGRRTRDPTGRVCGRTGDQDNQGGDRGNGVNEGVDKVPDFSTVIAQQLQNLLPTIIAQVGNHASNIQGDVRNVSVNNSRSGCSYKEFLECNPKDYDGKGATKTTTIQSVVLKDGMLTDEAIRIGSLKKNTKKRGNGREPSKDGNVRDDNKRSRTGREFASNTNPIRGMVVATKTTTIQSVVLKDGMLTDEAIRIGSLKKNTKKRGNGREPSKDGNVRDDNKRSRTGREFASNTNPVRKEYTGMDWLSRHKAEIVCDEKVVRIPLPSSIILRVLRERPEENVRHLMSVKGEEQKLKDIVIFLRTKEEHEGILELLNKEKLYAKFYKCEFWLQEVQFLGHLKIHEKNYTTHDLELGAVVFSFKIWRRYLYGKKSVMYTNHKSLQHIFNQKDLNMHQRRWIEIFRDYDCEIRYHPSKANVVANALSRKEIIKPRRVQAMNMTIQLSIKDKIPAAQNKTSEAIDAPAEMLQGLDEQMEPEIPEWKWERIAMDFTTKLRRTESGHDALWVILDRLTKSTHFLSICEDFKMDRLARLYLDEIIARHCVPILIISDRNSRFTSRFWQSMQVALGTRLDIKTTKKISQIKDMLKAARDHQKSYVDKRRKPLEFSVGDHVLLKVSPWK
nr:hypothetical protein [Tanacetum cinerariifolium]